MKNLWWIGVVVLLAGCDDVRLEPRFKFVPRFGEQPPSEALAEDVEERLEAVDAQLKRLERDLTGKTGAAKRELEEQLAALEKQKRSLDGALRDATRTGDQALKDVQRTTAEVLKDLERELKKLDEKVTSSR